MSIVTEQGRITSLVKDLIDNYEPAYGLGSMTCSVYDTAWVACVFKTVSGCPQWLFPSSFSFILNSQMPHGGWSAHPNVEDTDDIDGILSTMAAMFCLTQHVKNPLQLRHLDGRGLSTRIDKAGIWLSALLKKWRVSDCKAVGFEVLVPSLLDLLQEEAIHFEFPDKGILMRIRDQKLAKVQLETLYSSTRSNILHSLEAFHGNSDFSFDRISHQKVGGSMMASPSATASYLIRTSRWDDEAEAYLRLVISNGEGKGSGGVPSAYPSTNFELTWVVSTLLEADVWIQSSNEVQSQKILATLEESMRDGGLVGFAPGIEPDLDDSAKTSIIFSFLGRPGFTKLITKHFDSAKCLKTYRAERNPSVSANCNALLSIVLDTEEYQSKNVVIIKVTNFICDSRSDASGALGDKWNLSAFYPVMLIARSMTELLRAWDVGRFSELPRAILQEKVLPTLFQCLVWTLQSQLIDGSWGRQGRREETAYAILALASLIVLPIACFFRPQILSAISRGRKFLKEASASGPEYLWIEKVTYGSANLTEAYTTAALKCPVYSVSLGRQVQDLCNVYYKDMAEFGNLIERGPLSKCPKWLVLASWIEGRLCVPQLQKVLGEVLQPSETDEYQETTVFRWIFANNRTASTFSSHFLYSMINASILNERLITVVIHAITSQDRNLLEQTTRILKKGLKSFSEKDHVSPKLAANKAITPGPLIIKMASNGVAPNEGTSAGTSAINDEVLKQRECDFLLGQSLVKQEQYPNDSYEENSSNADSIANRYVLSFIKFFSTHCRLSKASEYDRMTLKLEVERFLLAQISRIERSNLMSQEEKNQSGKPHEPDSSIPHLGHSHTGATGFGIIFACANCLRGSNNQDPSPTEPQERVTEEIRRLTEDIFLLEQELHRSRWSTSTSEQVSSKDELTQRLLCGRERLSLAIVQLEELDVSKEVLKTVKFVVDVAEISGKAFMMKP